MAKLKQAVSEVKYVDQIGINQGGGFAVAARGQIQTANALNQIVSEWSRFALEETKDWGKKLGETEASEYDFGEKDVTYTDDKGVVHKQKIPTKVKIPTYLTTASSIEAFEKDIFLKYKKEVEASIDEIILDERGTAEKNYDTIENFTTIVNTRLEPLLKNLEPNFKQIIETYIKDKVPAHGRMVASNYDRFHELIKNVKYTSDHKTTLSEFNKALFYDDKDLIQTKLDEFKTTVTNGQNTNVINALGEGKQNIADAQVMVKVFKLFEGIHITDYDNSSPLQLTNTIRNYEKITSLLQIKGPNKVNLILSDGKTKTITKTDLNNVKGNNLGVFEDIRIALSNQINIMKGLVKDKVDTTNVLTTFDWNLNNEGMNASSGGITKDKYSEKIFSPVNLPIVIAKYNSLFDSSEHITIDDWGSSERFIKWIITEQQILPLQVKERIEMAYKNFNQNDVEALRNSSLITFMNDFHHTFSKEIDGSISHSTVGLDIFSTVGISKDTQNRIFAIESKLRLNNNLIDAIESTREYFDKFEKGTFSSLSQAVSFASGKRITNIAEVNGYVDETIVDLLDTITMWEPSISLTLSQAVKSEIHEYIMKGHPIIKLSDLDSAIKASMKYVLDGGTGYGFSKYTFSPFVNMKYDEGDFADRQHFVLDSVELFYSLPNKDGEMGIEWMMPEVYNLIKASPDFETMLPFLTKHKDGGFRVDFGKKIFLQSTGMGTNVAPKYNLVWVDKNGQARLIQDENGLPIFYDPSINYEDKRQELIMNDVDINQKIEDYKLQRIKKLKDYKKVSVAEMLMWLD